MNITKRLYTYPVLSEERDDYTDSVFDADVQYKMNGVNNLLFDFGIEMDNKELQKMILEGDAEYVVHIECTNTSYRTTIHDISNHVSKEISIGRINGRIEIIVLIVTKKDVNHFVNSNWNEDYRGLSFELSKGSILAYKNIPAIDIVKNYEEFNSASAVRNRIYKGIIVPFCASVFCGAFLLLDFVSYCVRFFPVCSGKDLFMFYTLYQEQIARYP